MTEDADSYITILKPAEALYKEKGSRFLAFAYPVSSEEAVKERLTLLKKNYYDATHHCYAYLLGAKKTTYKASDAGEPAHTAGDPILNQIRSKGITDALVVVVRYYGGVKLGASGLTSAYKVAAYEVLNKAEVIERVVTESFIASFPFYAMNEAMRLLKKANAIVVSRDFFENKVTICAEVKKSMKEQLQTELNSIR